MHTENTTMDTEKTTKNDTQSVAWRLPVELVDDMTDAAESAGTEVGWTDQLRKLLTKWSDGGGRCDVPKHAEDTKMVMLAIPTDVLRKLEREAERLTKLTGKAWSVARVVRFVWATKRRRRFS